MRASSTPVETRLTLMYHNVTVSGEDFGRIGESVTRYFVTGDQFARHLEHLASATSKLYPRVLHHRVVPNGEKTVATSTDGSADDGVGPLSVELTFDDGWLGSFERTVSLLERFDVTASVFVTTGLIGQPYFADEVVLREAIASGRFRIGAHGVTHRLLETLPPEDIENELRGSKDTLEQILGAEVDEFALPGGSRSATVIQLAKRAGFRRLLTSVPSTYPMLAETPIFETPRFAVQRDTSVALLQRWIDEPVGFGASMKHATLELAKTVLGRNRYAAVRRRLLGSRDDFDMTDLIHAPTL